MTALINGGGGVSIGGVAGTVVSFGTITGSSSSGINLGFGGSVTNGSASDKTALISGTNGVSATGVASTVVNFGMINGTANNGVGLTFGGSLTNGSVTDTVASISGLNAGVVFGAHAPGTLANFGTILCTDTTIGTASFAGVFAGSDAVVINGAANSTVALIAGYYAGVQIHGTAANVTNFGEVTASGTGGIGVYLSAGGTVTNGGPSNKSAPILSSGIGVEAAHHTGTVVNFGTIKGNGASGRGILLSVGGSVTNGSSADTSAYIGANNRNAVYAAGNVASTVVNFGTIKATGPANLSSGISVRGGGSITNGSTADTKALITGTNHGVYMSGIVASTVTNFGTITSSNKSAVDLYLGGHLINGSATDITARITGASAAYLGGPSTVTNFGTMTGTAGSALSLRGNSTVVNGSATDKTATLNVVGNNGTHSAIYSGLGTTTITNFGTIISSTSSAIHLNAGGTIVNGSTTDKTALISVATTGHSAIYIGIGAALVSNFGIISSDNAAIQLNGGLISNAAGGTITSTNHSGVYIITAAATVLNAGTIPAFGTSGTAGAALKAGGEVSNAATGIISSVKNVGVFVSGGAGTVINAGKITGAGGTQAVFLSAGFNNRVVADPGAVFDGTVNGGNIIGATAVSTLELASGPSSGTISGLGTKYINFARTTIDSGASWQLSGANTAATLTNNGTLAIAASATLDVTGAVDPTSTWCFPAEQRVYSGGVRRQGRV